MFHKHKYSKWSKAVDTSTQFTKAQFRTCEKCGKIKFRLINMHKCNSNSVTAEVINKALKQEV